MAVLGQGQQWITVQEKTFTKWWVWNNWKRARRITDEHSRLNSKVGPRDLLVNDVVTDLSDGVGKTIHILLPFINLPAIGHSYPSSRGPRF